MRVLALPLVLLCLAASPATNPADPVADAQRRLSEAQAASAKARSAAMDAVQRSPAYKTAKADADAKLKALEAARAGGTPQEKLDASAAYNAARLAAEKIVADAVRADASVKSSDAAIVMAKAESETAKRHAADAALAKSEAEKADAKRAEAERMKDPIYRAIKEGHPAIGMTEAQADEAAKTGGGYRKKVLSESTTSKRIEWGWVVPLEGGEEAFIEKWRGTISRGKLTEIEDLGDRAKERFRAVEN